MSENIQNKGVRYIYRRAFTLTEMLVAISVVAIVTAVTIPAIYAAREGFNSSGADTLISAALSSAKAIAAKEQKYAGVRFQCVPDPQRPGEPGDQYIVFIIQDSSLPTVNGFRAANGVSPMKLPVNQGVMDLMVKVNYTVPAPVDKSGGIVGDADITTPEQLRDTTTFSIIFSPSGRLVTHDVQVWNRDGKPAADDTSGDMIFNTKVNVDGAIAGTTPTAFQTYRGMFYQDDDAVATGLLGLCKESSRMNLLIYDKRDLAKVPQTARWTGYLQKLVTGDNSQVLYINPYTGTIIENQSHRNATK